MTTGRASKPGQGVWLGIAGGAIALGLLGFGIFRILNPQVPSAAQVAESPAPVLERVEVAALGRLEPRGEVIRVGGPVGERIARLEVVQGEQVKAGDVLAYLESYEEQKAQRDLAASQVVEAERRLRDTTTVGQAEIRAAETRLRQVREPGSAEIAAQTARIRELQAQLLLEQTNLQRNQTLRAEGAISQQALDQQVSRVRQLQEQIRTAESTLTQLQRRWQEDIRNAEAELRSQQASLPLAQVQVAVESARSNLALAEARLERTIIRAPRDGRVLRIVTRAGEAIANQGILDLGDTRQMYVVAEVYESDVGLVKVGQPAVITSRNGAFNEVLRGTVEAIGWQIFKNNVLDDDPAANADARVVEVKIRLHNSQPVEALTNLQVDVRIDVK
ncbi:MAG TPA: efflux RND transporter periplasmic adaptor subunit [Synechococcales cyanobacterium M55_K2018_004]|nr:efflux RND transporter periplasmic adaptor subunit [Synechococcales cyanobacterium M55_K2018_004]